MARTGGAERRIQFIETAQQLFYTKGYENTSVNDIINGVGVSKGAFYHHFDSKQAVLKAVVARLIAQTEAIIQPIVNDPNLNAIEKFNQMARAVNNWKIEQRDQMLAVAQIMYSDDNLLPLHWLTNERTRISIPMLAQIFEQGIAEGIFDLGMVQAEDSAEFIYSIWHVAGQTFINLLLDPNRPANAANIAVNKIAAAQNTMERILGAPAGSLPLVDKETIALWFA